MYGDIPMHGVDLEAVKGLHAGTKTFHVRNIFQPGACFYITHSRILKRRLYYIHILVLGVTEP